MLIHEHDIVVESNQSICAVSVWHSLEGLGEFLLSLINQKLSLVLLVQVVPLVVLSHVLVFRPITDSGSVVEPGTT